LKAQKCYPWRRTFAHLLDTKCTKSIPVIRKITKVILQKNSEADT
jgi:hypothetical protein